VEARIDKTLGVITLQAEAAEQRFAHLQAEQREMRTLLEDVSSNSAQQRLQGAAVSSSALADIQVDAQATRDQLTSIQTLLVELQRGMALHGSTTAVKLSDALQPALAPAETMGSASTALSTSESFIQVAPGDGQLHRVDEVSQQLQQLESTVQELSGLARRQRGEVAGQRGAIEDLERRVRQLQEGSLVPGAEASLLQPQQPEDEAALGRELAALRRLLEEAGEERGHTQALTDEVAAAMRELGTAVAAVRDDALPAFARRFESVSAPLRSLASGGGGHLPSTRIEALASSTPPRGLLQPQPHGLQGELHDLSDRLHAEGARRCEAMSKMATCVSTELNSLRTDLQAELATLRGAAATGSGPGTTAAAATHRFEELERRQEQFLSEFMADVRVLIQKEWSGCLDHLKGVRSELLNSAQALIEKEFIKRIEVMPSQTRSLETAGDVEAPKLASTAVASAAVAATEEADSGSVGRKFSEADLVTLDGEWRARASGCTVTILGGMLNWPGSARLQVIEVAANGLFLQVEVHGLKHQAEFAAGGTRLLWDDGDTWVRQDAEAPGREEAPERSTSTRGGLSSFLMDRQTPARREWQSIASKR